MGNRICRRGGAVLMALALVLVSLLASSPVARAAEAEGTCGDGLNWSFSAGTLTITGSGEMDNYTEIDLPPWYDLRDQIIRLELPEGLTRIGSLAFYECQSLRTLRIPDSVTSIGNYAFLRCTSLELLRLGSGVQSIGEYSFSECENLKSLSLPASVQTLGMKAFYRCQSLTSVVIPESVTQIGMMAFGYCTSLVSVQVLANITVIPDFLFYACDRLVTISLPETVEEVGDYVFRGCEQLENLQYEGEDEQMLEEILDSIAQDAPEDAPPINVTDQTTTEMVSSTVTSTNEAGNTVTETLSAVTTEDVTVSITTVTEKTTDVSVDVTIRNDEVWDVVQLVVDLTLKGQDSADSLDVNIYLEEDCSVSEDFVDAMGQWEADIQVTTQDGSIWRVDTTEQTQEETTGYDLRYVLSDGAELGEDLDTEAAFTLRFQSDAQVNAEVLISVGKQWARQNATLFQKLEGQWLAVQTTVVDDQGYAHFYLGAVVAEVEYAIGMNVEAHAESAIIPEELAQEYGTVDYIEPIVYEITGRTSSWGVNLTQVMLILGAVMIGVVVVTGTTLYLLNKRKLKHGYIPEWEDDEEM